MFGFEQDRILRDYTFHKRKQELYFVKENYDIFSKEISAREKYRQKNARPHQGVIGSLKISSAGWPF